MKSYSNSMFFQNIIMFLKIMCVIIHSSVSTFSLQLHSLSFYLLSHLGVINGVLITQWPKDIANVTGSSVNMHCYQNETDYDYLYWYQHKEGAGPVMMASYIVGSASYETGFTSGFKAWGVGKKQWSLTIESVEADLEAVYLCAASQHSETVLGSSIAKTTWQHITPLLQSPIRLHLFLESYKHLCHVCAVNKQVFSVVCRNLKHKRQLVL